MNTPPRSFSCTFLCKSLPSIPRRPWDSFEGKVGGREDTTSLIPRPGDDPLCGVSLGALYFVNLGKSRILREGLGIPWARLLQKGKGTRGQGLAFPLGRRWSLGP